MAAKNINDYIHALTEAKTIKDIHEVGERLCGYFGFDTFHYGARLPTSFTRPCFVNVSGYPIAWWERYKAAGHIRLDPVVNYCANNFMPLAWDRIEVNKRTHEAAWRIMGEAGEHGLKGGVSFPLHTAQGEAAMLSFATAQGDEYVNRRCKEILPEAHFITLHMHEAVRRLLSDGDFSTHQINLTDRERECLLWAADGKTTWETAQILKISERTVIFHVQNAAQKLNVTSRQQAVARAIACGLIRPEHIL